MTKREQAKQRLNSDITRITDNSPCQYEDVIDVLKLQLAWWRAALKDELAAQTSEPRMRQFRCEALLKRE